VWDCIASPFELQKLFSTERDAKMNKKYGYVRTLKRIWGGGLFLKETSVMIFDNSVDN
jgi:hypothetical protein